MRSLRYRWPLLAVRIDAGARAWRPTTARRTCSSSGRPSRASTMTRPPTRRRSTPARSSSCPTPRSGPSAMRSATGRASCSAGSSITNGGKTGPVELLPGRLRGLSRERPGRRPEPRRVPLAEQPAGPRIGDWSRGARSSAGSGSRPRRPRRSWSRPWSPATCGLLETVHGHARGAGRGWACRKEVIEQVAAAARASGPRQVEALQKGLTGWNRKTVWNRLDGTCPT